MSIAQTQDIDIRGDAIGLMANQQIIATGITIQQVTDGNDALTAFCNAYPNTDVQRIRQLIRSAHKEQSQGKPPKAFRELFKEIRRLDEEKQS